MRRVGSSPHARTMKSTCFGKCFFRYPSGQRTADPGAERPIPSRQSRPLFCRKAAQTFLCAQRARFFFPKRGASQPPILFSAAQPPRRFCAAPTSVGVDAGSPCVGRPESIPSKGVPAAPRAVGNKRERAAGAVQERKRQGDLRPSATEEGWMHPLDPRIAR